MTNSEEQEWFCSKKWQDVEQGQEIKLVSHSGTIVIGKVEENTDNYVKVSDLLFPKHELNWKLYIKVKPHEEIIPKEYGTVFQIDFRHGSTQTYFTLRNSGDGEQNHYILVSDDKDDSLRGKRILVTEEELQSCHDDITVTVLSTLHQNTESFTVEEIAELLATDSDKSGLSWMFEDGSYWFAREELLTTLRSLAAKRTPAV